MSSPADGLRDKLAEARTSLGYVGSASPGLALTVEALEDVIDVLDKVIVDLDARLGRET